MYVIERVCRERNTPNGNERPSPDASRLKLCGMSVRLRLPSNDEVLPDQVQPKDKAIRKSEMYPVRMS